MRIVMIEKNKTFKTLPVGLAAITALLMAVSALAHQHGHDDSNASDESVEHHKHHHKFHGKHLKKMHKMMMKKVDTNDDGKVDLTEYLAHTEERFKRMDLDSDGYVTHEEMREAHKIMREKHLEMVKEKYKKKQAADAESE